MSKCAIMQPTYLPWAGYFNLISQVDKFVFLDDVQFEKQSWQSRNRILLHGKAHLLSIPIVRDKLNTSINQIAICNKNHWQTKHWKTLLSAYEKAPHGSDVLDVLKPFYHDLTYLLLSELNQSIITLIVTALGLPTNLLRASELSCSGNRSDHLIALCEAIGCDEYLSPRGSWEYLHEDDFEGKSSIKLSFQNYTPMPYVQQRTPTFISHLSIIDVIAHIGLDQTRDYIKANQC